MKIINKLILLSGCLLLCLAGGARGYSDKESVEPKLVGAYGPATGKCWRRGDILFHAAGVKFEALDMAGPAPHRTVFQTLFNAWIDGCAISGNAVYFAMHTGELKMYDISEPTRPVERNAILWDPTITGGEFRSPIINESILIWPRSANWKEHDGGELFLDIHDPWNPKAFDSISYPEGASWIQGSHLYLLRTIRTSDYHPVSVSVNVYETEPTPVLISKSDLPYGDTESHWISGNMGRDGSTVFVWDQPRIWYIRDIRGSKPMSGQVNLHLENCHFWVEKGCAYVAPPPRSDMESSIFDLKDPANPVRLGPIPPNRHFERMDKWLSTVPWEEAAEVEISVEITEREPADLRDVAIEGNWAYLADAKAGLIILDLSNPSRPEFAGRCSLAGEPQRISLSEGKAYIAAAESGIHIIDVSKQTAPKFLSTTTADGNIVNAVAHGQFLYAADWRNGLIVFDVSDPVNPKRTPVKEVQEGCRELLADEDALYALGRNLYILNIRNPAMPQIIGSRIADERDSRDAPDAGPLGLVDRLAKYRDRLILLGDGDELYLMDVSSPTIPRFLAVDSKHYFGSCKDAWIQDDCLGVNRFESSADGFTYNHLEVRRLDKRPLPTTNVDLNWLRPGYSMPMINASCPAHGLIYLAAGDMGLLIIKDEFTRAE